MVGIHTQFYGCGLPGEPSRPSPSPTEPARAWEGIALGIVIPPPGSPVLILTGPPGVGKTTAAAVLADRHPAAVHLESDRFFHFIHSGYVEPWRPESHQQNAVVMRIVGEAAAGYASAGYFTIVDGIVIPRWFLTPLRDVLQAAGHAVAYVILRAPLDTCTARVQAREGTPTVDPEALAGIWSQLTDLGPCERNVLDVDGLSPAEAATAIEEILTAGSHLL